VRLEGVGGKEGFGVEEGAVFLGAGREAIEFCASQNCASQGRDAPSPRASIPPPSLSLSLPARPPPFNFPSLSL
jgi:hypothetical protein